MRLRSPGSYETSIVHEGVAELETFPDIAEFQNEAIYRSFAGKSFDSRMNPGFAAFAVNMKAARIPVYQPRQFDSVSDPRIHLPLRCTRTVAGGKYFDNKFRGNSQELPPFRFTQRREVHWKPPRNPEKKQTHPAAGTQRDNNFP